MRRGDYLQIASAGIDGREVVAWSSEELEDQAWDDFLRGVPGGQYQQSSLWARGKRTEGWNPLRVILTSGDRLIGGCQILWRRAKFLRLGYVSKGPVADSATAALITFLVQTLRTAVKSAGISALIVQAPDRDILISPALAENQFLPNKLNHVYEYTLVVDLRPPWEAIEARISRYTLKKTRQAVRRGTSIREGTRQDLSVFFELMRATCERQSVRPNPASLETLYEIWDAAEPGRRLRLTFAEHNGVTVGGLICFSFGEIATAWKKGWSGTAGEFRPNELLIYDAIRWASGSGHKDFDFSSLDKSTAEAMLAGQPLAEEENTGRDFFQLRFGGAARALPRSLVYYPNPLIRTLYRQIGLPFLNYREQKAKSEKSGWFYGNRGRHGL